MGHAVGPRIGRLQGSILQRSYPQCEVRVSRMRCFSRAITCSCTASLGSLPATGPFPWWSGTMAARRCQARRPLWLSSIPRIPMFVLFSSLRVRTLLKQYHRLFFVYQVPPPIVAFTGAFLDQRNDSFRCKGRINREQLCCQVCHVRSCHGSS